MLRSAKVLEKDLIRATFRIKKWKVSHKESHQRSLIEVNKRMLLSSWCLWTWDSQSRGTESCAFYLRSRQLVNWSFMGLSLQCLQSTNWDKQVDSRATTCAWMAPGGVLVGWPGCRQRDLAFRRLRTNIDSFAPFCTWQSTRPTLGYMADLCSGGHLPCFLILPAGTWAALTPSGSGCCICLLGVPTLCLRGSPFASQRSARLPSPTTPPSSVFQQLWLYFVALTHRVGVCCSHLLTFPTGWGVPLHPVTPLDKCHLQAKQDPADRNRNETQNRFPNSY